ncbi:MAG: anthranilate synthase component I [Candidatus Omnitrophica bacterium]|nr:anthranilate synthase component I [Candidatus Omnitrophota bacterium]
MRITSYAKFKKMYTKGNHIPVWKEILADMETPVSVLYTFLEKEQNCFLLESVEHAKNIGRFSIIGIRPSEILCNIGNLTKHYNPKGRLVAREDRPVLDVIDQAMRAVRFVADPELEGCISGYVGHMGFECVSQFEDIVFRPKKRLHEYDAIFFLAKTLIVFDHFSHRLRVIKVVEKTGALKKDYDEAIKEIEAIARVIAKKISERPARLGRVQKTKQKIRPLISKQTYIKDVNRVKEYIKQGDAIQVVYSQRFNAGRITSPFNVYRALRTINPSPYMFYFKYRDIVTIGSSPEVLVKKEKNKAIIRPIAGTRQRGENDMEDRRREEDLRRSPKENAEHLMLVDLARNDIGVVCDYGSISVERLAYVEKFSHVMHLVSNVEGTLRRNKNAVDLLKATFPAGTVSGAPKIRAMQIIDELEAVKRGPYAGALGYIGFSGDMDMCIMIRSMFIEKGKVYLQAGGGIVYDSNPIKEYEETINKAGALFHAIDIARGFSKDE